MAAAFASGTVVGPVLYARCKGIHFFGEHHHVNGTGISDKDYVLNKLLKLDGNVVLIIEASPNDLPQLIASPPISPLRQLARSLKVLPPNIDVVFANIRCSPPFCAFEAIYNFEGFAQMGIHTRSDAFANEYRSLWLASKRFEKQFISHVATTRQGCARFMKSIAHPDFEPPAWFIKCLKDMNIGLDNPFKETMRQLRQADPILFEKLMGTMASMFDKRLLDNKHFSQGMDKAARIRRTGSVNMVIEKYPYLQAFWVSINAIFMDVFMLYKIFEARTASADAQIVVLAGKNHVVSILQQFNPDLVHYVYNHEASLDMAALQPGPIVCHDKSPQSLMKHFIENNAV